MIEPLRILCCALLTIGSCFAVGRAVLDHFGPPLGRGELWRLAFVPGAAVLSTVFFLLLLAGWAQPGVLVTVEVAVLAAAWWRRGKEHADVPAGAPVAGPWRIAFLVIFAGFGLLYVSHAVGNGAVAESGGRLAAMVRPAVDLESGVPHAVDHLLLPALATGSRTAAGLVRVTFLLLLPGLMLDWGRRAGASTAAVFGAVFAFASPAMGFTGTSALDGVAMAAILFTLFLLLERDAGAVGVGLTAGFACAAGYSGFLALPYVCAVLVRRRQWRRVAASMALALLVVSPWLVRNTLIGNPVSPFFTRHFANPVVTPEGEREYIQRSASYAEVRSPIEIPLQAAILGGSLGAPAGPLFLLAPFALLALGSPPGRRLLFAAVVLGAAYPLNPGTRFLTPVLPFVSLAMGLVFANTRVLAPALLAIHATISLPMLAARYTDAATPRIRGPLFRPLIHLQAPPPSPVAAMLKGRTFALAPFPADEVRRDVIVAGSGAESDRLADLLRTPITPGLRPALWRTFHFAPQTVAILRISAANRAAARWRVAELRAYHGGAELARSPGWRLDARPNPWDVGLAFDNSPVTAWESRQDVEAGMYLELNIGHPEVVDRVVLEGPDDQSGVRVELSSRGKRIVSRVEDVAMLPSPTLRRAAIRELRARGIGYLLARESDVAARDFDERAGLWGIVEAGRAEGYRLWRILPERERR